MVKLNVVTTLDYIKNMMNWKKLKNWTGGSLMINIKGPVESIGFGYGAPSSQEQWATTNQLIIGFKG